MRSAKSSVNGSKTAAMWLTVLIIVVLRALAPGAGWSQETAQPRIDEELKKQEKIFQRRGADVPRGYVTGLLQPGAHFLGAAGGILELGQI